MLSRITQTWKIWATFLRKLKSEKRKNLMKALNNWGTHWENLNNWGKRWLLTFTMLLLRDYECDCYEIQYLMSDSLLIAFRNASHNIWVIELFAPSESQTPALPVHPLVSCKASLLHFPSNSAHPTPPRSAVFLSILSFPQQHLLWKTLFFHPLHITIPS